MRPKRPQLLSFLAPARADSGRDKMLVLVVVFDLLPFPTHVGTPVQFTEQAKG
jgi:hypothetical protein